jgi:hypothetical protein
MREIHELEAIVDGVPMGSDRIGGARWPALRREMTGLDDDRTQQRTYHAPA